MAGGERLRVGFVGCGRHASTAIWPCLRYAPIDVVHACARTAESAELNRRTFGAEHATTDVGEVLSDDSVQAVFVVGPPTMHHAIGLRVLDAGKHLFIEKPPGPTLAHALELEDAARRNGVQCQVAFQKRFALAYRLAREVAQRPDFGGVRLCKLNYSHWLQPDWRAHLAEMSVHPLDLVRFFMGDPVHAYVLKRSAADGRNTCVLTLVYEPDASAVVNMSANDPHVQEWVELSGANQLISVRNLVEYRHWADGSDAMKTLELNEAAVGVWHPAFAIPYQQADSMWLQGYAGQVVEFAQAILDGRPVSASIADGVMAMRYVEAIALAPEGMSELDLRAGEVDAVMPAAGVRADSAPAESPGGVASEPERPLPDEDVRPTWDRLACSTLTFRMLPLDRALERIAASGVRTIDLTVIPHFCPHADPLGGDAEHARVADLVARAGLRVASVNATSLTHLNDDEGVALAYLRGSLELAAAVGAAVVTVQPGRSVADEDWREAAVRVSEVLNDLGAEARAAGVELAVEAPHVGTLAEGFDRASRLLEWLDPALVAVTFDTSHVRDAGATIAEALRRHGPRVRHVHLRDYRDGDVLVTPGDGEIDFSDVFARFQALGYDGVFAVELEYHDATAEKNERELARALAFLSGLEPVASAAGLETADATFPGRRRRVGRVEIKPLRAGIVGSGLRGEAHVTAMRASGAFEPTALCDVDEQRLAVVGHRQEIDRVYTDVAELVEREGLELLVVATPPGPRAEIVERAVGAGARYLLIEKPIALHPRDTETIRALGNRAAIVVNTQYQWMPHWQRFWARLAAGELGEVDTIRCSTRANVIAQGSHTGDLALRGARVCGLDAPEWVLAGVAGVDWEDSVPVPADFAATIGLGEARMHWTHGPSAPAVPSESIHFYQIQVEFLGSRGRLWVTLNQGWTLWTESGVERGRTEWPGDDEHAQVALLGDLAQAIRDGAMDEFPTRVEEAARVDEVIFACYASALDDSVVPLPRVPQESDVDRLAALLSGGVSP